MPLDFATLDALRSHHPAWRLLRSDHAPLVASFLHRVFVTPNVRDHRIRPSLRLEQEHIGFGWLEKALKVIQCSDDFQPSGG